MTQQTTPTPDLTHHADRRDRRLRLTGAWCLAAGLVGALQAAVVVLWPEQVSADRYSYPFTPLGLVVAQATFFVQHLPLVAALAALRRLTPVRSSRVARASMTVAAAGMALLTLMEVVNMTVADVATDSDRAALVGALYGLPTTIVGLGLLVGGAAVWRGGRAGWEAAPWTRPLIMATGVFVFVPLTPAIMGPFVAGRAAIGLWMLMFAALGVGLVRMSRPPRGVPTSSSSSR